VDNIVKACNGIFKSLIKGEYKHLTSEIIKELNLKVLTGLPIPQNVTPGEVRRYFVGVGRYRGAPAEDCEYLLERLCSLVNDNRDGVQGLDPLSSSVLLAMVTHLYIAWIHPFGDGNGRTARLLEFMLLLQGGAPAPAAHLLSNHYNATRQAYYAELDRASASGGDIVPFVLYALRGLRDGLGNQIEEIRGYQLRMIWRDHVSHALAESKTRDSAEIRTRRRELVEALTDVGGPVPLSGIAALTPSLAAVYARKTRKTLTRDIHALQELGLVETTQEGVRARVDTMLAFLPPKAEKQ